jgi:hypothetical protein
MSEMTIEGLVAQIKSLDPRALTLSQQDAALTIIEYLREEMLKLQQDNLERMTVLDERERDLERREAEVRLALRAAEAIIKPSNHKTWWSRWRNPRR